MNMKILLLVISIVIVFLVALFFIIKIPINNKKDNCVPFSGGSFNINFVVNGGENIPSMLVGIACCPDSYRDLPIPVRDGYIFDGWYYDKDFTKKIEFTSSIDIKPVPKYDNKCQVGFEDIEIYAKWKKNNF